MSIKTITMTGYAMRYDETDPDPAFLTAMPTVEDGDEEFIFTPATLVIGPGKVFTEDEVKAMVLDMMSHQHVLDAQNRAEMGVDFRAIAAKHGLTI